MPALLSFAVWCALSPLASSTSFRFRGNNTAPSGNYTFLPTLTSASVVRRPLPAISSLAVAGLSTFSAVATSLSPIVNSTTRDTAPYPGPSSWANITGDNRPPRPTEPRSFNVSVSKNYSGPACTINIPSANLDWWFAATYEHPIATLSSFRSNGTDAQTYLTAIPHTATFDVTSALISEAAFTERVSYDSFWGWEWTIYEEYTVKPSAAATSVVTRTAALPLPTVGYAPFSDASLYELDIYDLAPATLAVTAALSSTFVATSATPFLYFTAYEVESAVVITEHNGRLGTRTITESFELPNTLAYPYSAKGVEDYATATDIVPAEFIQNIPQSSCGAGLVQATVTVLVVVDITYINQLVRVPFLVRIESTATGFGDVTDDPPVVVFNTRIFGMTQNTATSSAIIKPAVVQTVPTPTDAGIHDAGSDSSYSSPLPEPTRVTVGAVGTDPVVIGPSSVVVVGTHTLQPGGPGINVGGQDISLAPSATAIVIGGKTSELPQVILPSNQVRPVPILTIGSSTLTGNAATQFFISPGQTLTAGGTATVGDVVVSLDSSASFIVIGSSTQMLPDPTIPTVTTPPKIVIGGSTITANAGTAPTFTISGQKLAPGQVRTIGGTVISLAPSASFVVINGATTFFGSAAPAATARPVITIGDSTFTANARDPDSAPTFVINGQTLITGQGITVDGTTISLGPSGSFVVINGATSTFPAPVAQITAPPLTIGTDVFTTLSGPGTTYLIGTQTLTPGGAITVSGTTISLAPSATALVINGHTTLLSGNQPQAPPITNAPILTIGSHVYTAVSGTTFLIGFGTLTPGGTVVIDGTTISLSPGATQLVYGSSGRSTTTALFPATTTGSQIVTQAGDASAGVTRLAGAAATSSQKGAAWSLKSSGLQAAGWVLLAFVGCLVLLV